jgi:hypothetical protein
MESELTMEKDQAEKLRDQAENQEISFTGSLPSRKEVHQNRKNEKKKAKIQKDKKDKKDKKQKKPSFLLTKILLVAFIAMVCAMVTYQYWSEKLPVHSELKKGIELVNIEE